MGPEKTSHTVVSWWFGFSGLACVVVIPAYWIFGFVGVGGLWWCGVGVLFENCIVDASIFVVKLLRANGGCLGTRSR